MATTIFKIAVLSSPCGISVSALELDQSILFKIEEHYGAAAYSRILQWQWQMLSAQELTTREKLKVANDFFNQQINFTNDHDLWHAQDYWATPLEFLIKGAGDCEDFAIAKYFTLKALGINEEKIRITYVKSLDLNQAHMVLTYFETPKSSPLVLDNLITEIKFSTSRMDLLPIYSFNASGLWSAKKYGIDQFLGSSTNFNLWENLISRINKINI